MIYGTQFLDVMAWWQENLILNPDNLVSELHIFNTLSFTFHYNSILQLKKQAEKSAGDLSMTVQGRHRLHVLLMDKCGQTRTAFVDKF